jgi:hypothetical protein
MLFMLQPSPTPTAADSDNSFNLDDDDTFLDDEDDDGGVTEESGPKSTKQPTKKKQKTTKKEIENEELVLMKKLSNSMSQSMKPQAADACDIFGQYVTQSLKSLDPRDRHIAQHRINEIIFQAQMGLLNQPVIAPQPQTYPSQQPQPTYTYPSHQHQTYINQQQQQPYHDQQKQQQYHTQQQQQPYPNQHQQQQYPDQHQQQQYPVQMLMYTQQQTLPASSTMASETAQSVTVQSDKDSDYTGQQLTSE